MLHACKAVCENNNNNDYNICPEPLKLLQQFAGMGQSEPTVSCIITTPFNRTLPPHCCMPVKQCAKKVTSDTLRAVYKDREFSNGLTGRPNDDHSSSKLRTPLINPFPAFDIVLALINSRYNTDVMRRIDVEERAPAGTRLLAASPLPLDKTSGFVPSPRLSSITRDQFDSLDVYYLSEKRGILSEKLVCYLFAA